MKRAIMHQAWAFRAYAHTQKGEEAIVYTIFYLCAVLFANIALFAIDKIS